MRVLIGGVADPHALKLVGIAIHCTPYELALDTFIFRFISKRAAAVQSHE